MNDAPREQDPEPPSRPGASGDAVHPAAEGVMTFAIRILASALSLGSGIAVARILGQEEYGFFAFCLAWAGFLYVLVDLGLATLIIQRTAVYAARGEWGLLRGLLRWSDRVVGGTSLLVISVAATAAAVVWMGSARARAEVFLISLLLTPINGLLYLRASTLVGLRRVVTSQLLTAMLRPALFLGALALLYAGWGGGLSPRIAMSAKVGTNLLTLGASILLVRAHRPRELRSYAPTYATRDWSLSALPMFLLLQVYMVSSRIDVVMLGTISGMRDAGVYDAASQWAGAVTYPMMALTIVVRPLAARLHALGERRRLQRTLVRGLRLAFALSICIYLGQWATGTELLSWYGRGYGRGYWALMILASGQLATMLFGPVWPVLTMTGQAKRAVWLVAGSAALNVILNSLAIPRWGIEGAALSTAISVNAMRGAGVWLVRRHVGVGVTLFDHAR